MSRLERMQRMCEHFDNLTINQFEANLVAAGLDDAPKLGAPPNQTDMALAQLVWAGQVADALLLFRRGDIGVATCLLRLRDLGECPYAE